jgi:ABC-type nitrate/sulfonate/bicarbonate transport system substrate-binding protein
VIIANDQILATHPDAVRAFLTATFAGWSQALADILAAAELVAKQYAADGSKYKDVKYQARSLELIADYIRLNVGSDGIGVIDPATWTEASELMANYGIIDALPSSEASLATGFWPTV